tara:strand:- start:32 stop:607 length:576 start_codon:yes stop_codon:yes gene_type:complete
MEDFIENYAQIPQSKRILYALIGGVVIVVLFLIGVHNEEQERYERMQVQAVKLDRDVTKKRAYVQNMEKYKARFQQLELELARAKTVLPDTADVAQLLSVLGNKARDVGLSIDRFEPLGETTKDFYSEILFTMKLKGTYHEIATYIDSIGKMDRIVNVTGISMSNPTAEDQRVILDGEFIIKTYRFLTEGG